MLKALFNSLDEMMQSENARRFKSDAGQGPLPPCEFRVLGQFALVEAHISKVATRDVDAQTDSDQWVKEKFDKLLQSHGLVWDPLSHEICMPEETEFDLLFKGKLLTARIAKPEYILVSKAIYASKKNRGVFEEYFALGPSDNFLKLCKKYKIDLSDLLGVSK